MLLGEGPLEGRAAGPNATWLRPGGAGRARPPSPGPPIPAPPPARSSRKAREAVRRAHCLQLTASV